MLEKTLESHLDSKEKILKEINPEYLLEGLLLKLKLQHFGHPKQRAGSLVNILMLRNTEGKSKRGQHRMQWLGSITDSMDMNLSKELTHLKRPQCWERLKAGGEGDYRG